MAKLPRRTRNTLLALGVAQGLLLLLGYLLIDSHVWDDAEDAIWFLPWFTVALAVPSALQLVINDARDRRVWLFGLALAGVLALTGMYAGFNIAPHTGSQGDSIAPYVLTTFFGWYVLLPFVQAVLKTGKLNPAYPDLFEFAWNNGITLLIAKIFTGIFWALLALWAGLFEVIGVKFFSALFFNQYFAFPVTAAVVASAIYLGRNHVHAVTTVRRIILAVFKGLLPLLALISLLFLAALPIMGLKPLWATGKGTVLMVWLQVLVMIFLNAVYQDGKGEPPYPTWLRKLVQAAVVVLPIYTLLCVYALSLRIDQHGWSTDRFWAMLLVFVVGLHVFGYAVAALRQRAVWMAGMAPVNIRIAAVVVALSVLVNSPILDAHRISTSSQVGRLLSGKVDAANFDFKYVRFGLGRHGNNALAKLKDVQDHPQAEAIRTAAGVALNQTDRWGGSQTVETASQASGQFSVFPRTEKLDDAFLKFAVDKSAPHPLKRCLEVGSRCAIVIIDLNRDRIKEYVVHRIGTRWDRYTMVFTKSGNGWQNAGQLQVSSAEWDYHTIGDLEADLAKGNYAVVDDPWQNLRIGKHTRTFRAENR